MNITISSADLEAALEQSKLEGLDISNIEADVHKLSESDLNSPASQNEAVQLLLRMSTLPEIPGYVYDEPAVPEGGAAILESTATGDTGSTHDLSDHMDGAWLGMCIGIHAASPLQNIPRKVAIEALKASSHWPISTLTDSFELDRQVYATNGTDVEMVDKLKLSQYWGSHRITEHALAALSMVEQNGEEFLPGELAMFCKESYTCAIPSNPFDKLLWLGENSELRPSFSPYREGSSALSTSVIWGLIAADNPPRAAHLATADAAICHTKNGLYTCSWLASLAASSCEEMTVPDMISESLAHLPATSRLADVLESVLEWYSLDIDLETAIYRVHELWNEANMLHRYHSIPNAMIIAIALIWSEWQFDAALHAAASSGFDVVGNTAAVCAVVGAHSGLEEIGEQWIITGRDNLKSGSGSSNMVSLSDAATRTYNLVQTLRNYAQIR